MKAERLEQVSPIFRQAVALSTDERAIFLETACAGDTALRHDVEQLISAHERAGSFIEAPAFETAASLIAEERAGALRGKTIGHYHVLKLIGTGGMGEVYLAEDTALNRKAALKVLLPAYAGKDQDSLLRFRQEARAASALSHPNIAHIYEIGEADGANFIAMEYVEGQLLDARIGGRPLASAEIADIAVQVADALDEAHAKGIAHRDIKSANIIITARGQVKVLDFGLAKTVSPAERGTMGEPTGLVAQVKTRPGVVLGTVSYMSPEQALGREVDHRTDIFSLGVVLYEMATGRLPFTGQSVTETINNIAHAQPDAMARFNYDVPEELERIVKKALRKSQHERYQTARDLLVDLKNLKREMEFASQHDSATPGLSVPVAARVVARSGGESGGETAEREAETAQTHTTSSAEYIVGEIRRHKRGAALALAILIVAAAAITVGLRRFLWPDPAADGAPRPPHAMKSERLITSATSGKAGNASISPDGKFVVYKDDETDGRQALWIKQVAIGTARQIVPPDEVQYRGTTFSRDGNLVYYVVMGTKHPAGVLYQVPVNGGPAKQLLVNISGPVTQSPDGQRIAFVHEKTLMVANADGTAARPLASRTGSGFLTYHGPAWSPDGKTIACGGVEKAGGTYGGVFAVEVASGEIRKLTSHKWGGVRRVLWLGDGSGLVVLAYDVEQAFSQIWEVSYPNGAVRRITNDLNGHGHVSLGLTANSSVLVAQQEEDSFHVWVVAQDDPTNPKQLTSGEGLNDGRFGLSWTPDGKVIYASRGRTAWDLWQIKPTGAEQSQLTSDSYRDQYPVVTPDGRTVVFESTHEDGAPHIWRMGLDGGQPKQLTGGNDHEDKAPRVSPDGRWVVYSSRSADQERLWRVAIDGGGAVQLTDYTSSSPDVSPDGKLIACTFFDGRADPARWRVALIPFAGGPPVKTIDLPATADVSRSIIDGRAVAYVRWLAGGRAIAYVNRSKGVSNIWSQPLDGGPPRQLTNFTSGLIFNFELSPDGKQIACARGARTSDVILITDFR